MPAEVVLMMDLAGVLTTSPFPAARRLSENMMRCVFERAGAHMINRTQNHSVEFLAHKYSNFFFTVIDFTERTRGIKSAFERLELGELNRLQFIPEFKNEIAFMLQTLGKNNVEELEGMNIANPTRVGALKKRFPLLSDPIIQTLVLEIMDVEAFLCTLEKISPRKNVLNLLHYLRVKSQQEIRLFAMGNTWEGEGQYRRMLKALSSNYPSAMSSIVSVSCPIEYGSVPNSYFQVNSLFDGSVQSYTYHKRKPYPDIYMHAIDTYMQGRIPTGDALRYNLQPNIFYFDDVAGHCEVARGLPGNPFTEVYFIDNGAVDVYNDIVKALKIVGAKDAFWAKIVEGVEKDIGPLFQPPADPVGKPISWIEEELKNYNNNLLFIPPPAADEMVVVNPLEKNRYHMDLDDQDAILYYCAQHLPHLFPLAIPETAVKGMHLWEQRGLATSAGPIVFEHVGTNSKYYETYRITLRTGSYTLRIQPRGPSPYGTTDIRREYDTMSHLCDVAPGVNVPNMLFYCDSYAVCGRRFFLRRYQDGENIVNVQQLVQPRIRRPYSERRRKVSVELRPILFFRAAVQSLVALHDAPLPPFMKQEEDKLRRSKSIVHPLLKRIRAYMGRYNLAVSGAKGETQGAIDLQLKSVETLAKNLFACFDQTEISHAMIPMPERLVVVHGNFDMSSLVFSHRSMEGRYKYPPELVSAVKFRYTHLDDPLIDVSTLALFHYLPAPEGIYTASREVQNLFPTPAALLDLYCNMRGYMRHLNKSLREDIFNVYLATLCLDRATLSLAELGSSIRANVSAVSKDELRNIAFAEQLARRGNELLMQRSNSNGSKL